MQELKKLKSKWTVNVVLLQAKPPKVRLLTTSLCAFGARMLCLYENCSPDSFCLQQEGCS